MVPINRRKVSLYEEAKNGLSSLIGQTATVFVCFIVMLLLTGGNPSGFAITITFILGIAFVAWREQNRFSKLWKEPDSSLDAINKRMRPQNRNRDLRVVQSNNRRDISSVGTNPLSDVFSVVRANLQQAASNPDLFTQIFGDKANTSEFQAIVSQWKVGDFSQLPPVQVIFAADMNGADGAYVSSTRTIYISDALLKDNAEPVSIFGVVAVLVEETFCWLDDRVGSDTQSDEGELAKILLCLQSLSLFSGASLSAGASLSVSKWSRITNEDDRRLINRNNSFSIDIAKSIASSKSRYKRSSSNIKARLFELRAAIIEHENLTDKNKADALVYLEAIAEILLQQN